MYSQPVVIPKRCIGFGITDIANPNNRKGKNTVTMITNLMTDFFMMPPSIKKLNHTLADSFIIILLVAMQVLSELSEMSVRHKPTKKRDIRRICKNLLRCSNNVRFGSKADIS